MHIVELRSENFKRIQTIAIRPEGNMVHIRGKNGEGKTSVLDSIWAALGGGLAIPTVPIRLGQEQAVIKLDLGSFRVTRTFKAKEDGSYTTSIKVEGADGRKYEKPQAMLDAMVGSLSFDPLSFTRQKPKEQFDTLRQLVPGVDFASIARQQRADFDARTDLNRQAKSLREQVLAISVPAGKIPARVDTAEVVKKITDASAHNSEIERRAGARKIMADEVASLHRQIVELTDRKLLLQNKLDTADPLPAPIDVAALNASLSTASETNKIADDYERRARLEREAEQAEKAAGALTTAMDDREAAKREAIAAASMPVNGLGFGEDCILMDGLPFEQASAAQQLRASLAIATALNPKLRVIMIKDASLLDREAMKWVTAHAEQYDMQVWAESVSDGGVGFILEDGMIKEPEVESF